MGPSVTALFGLCGEGGFGGVDDVSDRPAFDARRESPHRGVRESRTGSIVEFGVPISEQCDGSETGCSCESVGRAPEFERSLRVVVDTVAGGSSNGVGEEELQTGGSEEAEVVEHGVTCADAVTGLLADQSDDEVEELPLPAGPDVVEFLESLVRVGELVLSAVEHRPAGGEALDGQLEHRSVCSSSTVESLGGGLREPGAGFDTEADREDELVGCGVCRRRAGVVETGLCFAHVVVGGQQIAIGEQVLDVRLCERPEEPGEVLVGVIGDEPGELGGRCHCVWSFAEVRGGDRRAVPRVCERVDAISRACVESSAARNRLRFSRMIPRSCHGEYVVTRARAERRGSRRAAATKRRRCARCRPLT